MKDFEQRVLERMPSNEEERASLGRVWSQVERAGGWIPDDVLRSVQRSPARHQPAWTFLPRAVAAVLVLGAAIGTAIVWPRGVQAYAAGADGLQVTLADDSRVEMRAHAEMTVTRESDGIQIDLKKGDIIVSAAKQRDGHLSVQTNDMTVAAGVTVFALNADDIGSRVTVIEGEVRVRQGTTETRLTRGEQVSTHAALALRPVKEDVGWSPRANAILAAFSKGMADTAGSLTPLREAPAAQADKAATAAAPREFEEASIRPCDADSLPETPDGARGGGANSFQMTPGRIRVLCMTPATIIREAYGYGPADFNPGGRGRGLGRLNVVYGLGVEDGRRVRGGPDWVRSQRYTIEAVTDETANAATMGGPMLQALVERRFRLKMHIETEQIPAYTLTVAEGGLKMKQGPCTQPPPDAPPVPPSMERVRRNVAAVRRGEATAGPCGFSGGPDGPNMLYVGAGAGVPALGGILGAPVSNQTGIPPTTGGFNYVLEFAPDERTPGVRCRQDDRTCAESGPADPSNVPRLPDIFTAVEQQLGLKLQPTQTPREFIVIDHIERPSAN